MDTPLIGGEPTVVDLYPTPLGVMVARGEEGGDYPPIRSFRDIVSVWRIESTKMWLIAGPIIFNICCNYGTNSFTNIFVGHIGDVELSAVTVAFSVFGSFVFGLLLGMGSALETLCGQAFGAGQIHMLGIYTQRSWLILLGTCCALLPLYSNATSVLLVLGQEPRIAELAGKFTKQCIPQMFAFAINFPSQKFLQAQSKVGVTAYIGFVALIAHVGLLYLFIEVFGWGTSGAACAFNVSAWVVALAQFVYMKVCCKDAWTGFSWLAFKDLWPFVKLSVASAVMTCLDIWYFMSIMLLTGQLQDPVISIGSLSICVNITGWEGVFFLGINAAISVRVANELGSGHPRTAKFAVAVTIAQSLFIGFLFMCIIMLTKDHFAVIFTNSREMQRAVAHLAYLVGITMVLNSIQPVIAGVAVGGGWQALVAYINLFCYYGVGLPLGLLLGYKTTLGVEVINFMTD
ncbi:protein DETOXIFICATION 34-like [Silene latifolia]|uniref:protein DETOXIFICATION 34-like n=1 Tax=Silene latifolia TaxID=37657 RepID=UPI003D77CFDF